MIKDFYSEHIKRQNKRNKFERKLDEYNHTMELIRTIFPIILLIMQIIILIKIFQ
jgi:heme/copper-type cytochrome/quinol oxidase subunit 2